MTLTEAIQRGRHAFHAKYGKCTMCAAGDEPVFGYHKHLVPCARDTHYFYRHSLARIFKVDVAVIDRWMDTDKLSWMRDGLGRRCCAYGHVRHFIMLYGRETAEVKVDQLRRDIFTTYQVHTHAFERGCGRDTMRGYVCDASGTLHSARAIRRALDEMAKEGLFVRGTNLSGHTTYSMGNPPSPEPAAPQPTQPGWRIESQGPGELILRRMTDPTLGEPHA
jgi:hypothetical protein